MYKKAILLVVSFLFLIGISSKAQQIESFYHSAEFGVSVGAAHYFGDLNPSNNFIPGLRPKLSAGIFVSKQLSDYIAIKASGSYAFLGYSDTYSKYSAYRSRNLSFNTHLWEVAVQGTFHFFRFVPTYPEHRFTPYVSLGVGLFTYNPYAFFRGNKYYLRNIGTEGQQNSLISGVQPYSRVALSFPLSIGVKYALNSKMNVFSELCFRFTNTDYLDDVSGVYAHNAFNANSIGYLLQDRSFEVSNNGQNLFSTGKQRGNSTQKDAFVTMQVGISFNIQSYRCPTF
ncbi:MAG: DUF6089 family protein [Chitinophagaceae bacterium]